MRYRTRFTLYCLVMVLYGLASNFAHPVTPTIIQELRLHDYMFGVALAMMLGAQFLFSPFWGKLNQFLSSRTSLLIGCCGYGLAQLGFALATTEGMIICARFVAGMFVGAVMVSMLTYIVNAARPEDQPRYLTYSATIQSVAGAFGYLIGGVLGEFSVRMTFFLQSGTLIVTGVLFYLVCLPDADCKQERPAPRQLLRDANPVRAFVDCRGFMTGTFVLLFAVNVLINFANTGFDQAFNYFLKDQLGLTSAYNGVIKAAVGLVSFVSNLTLCIWIIRRTDNARSLTLLVALCALAALGTLAAPGIGLFVSCSVLVYAGYSVSLPVLQNMVATQSGAGQKNLVMGCYNATKSLGSIAGSLTAGFIYAANVRLPFAVTALIYAVGVAVAAAYLVRRRKAGNNTRGTAQ